MSDIDVSIIIPAFNEQERIAATLYAMKDFLETKEYKTEILVIDDGSVDFTAEIIRVVDIYCQELKSQSSCVLVENIKNVGKGYSIAKGMLLAKGNFVVFTDADLATPANELEKLLTELRNGYDVVVGSRRLPGSVVDKRSISRELASELFSTLVRIMGLASVSDSQCGFKAYRRDAAQLIANRQKTYGYCFDVEQLVIASRTGLKIAEVPIVWHERKGSSVRVLRDSFSMFFDLCRIIWLHRNTVAESKSDKHGISNTA